MLKGLGWVDVLSETRDLFVVMSDGGFPGFVHQVFVGSQGHPGKEIDSSHNPVWESQIPADPRPTTGF